MKLYPCEIPDCQTQSQIRTQIRNPESEYNGLKVCKYHASIHNLKKVKSKKPKTKSDQTKRAEARRKDQRKDFPQFFQKHIEIARSECCAECGTRLTGHVSEIVHLVKKTSAGGNPELATEDLNIVYLCGMYSDNQCHSKYDSSLETRENMKVFPLALERFRLLEDKIENWTTTEVRHYMKHL